MMFSNLTNLFGTSNTPELKNTPAKFTSNDAEEMKKSLLKIMQTENDPWNVLSDLAEAIKSSNQLLLEKRVMHLINRALNIEPPLKLKDSETSERLVDAYKKILLAKLVGSNPKDLNTNIESTIDELITSSSAAPSISPTGPTGP